MLEAKYYRDYGHNYMILQCQQQETARGYQYKILTSGKIGEILKCSVRYINGSTFYYYDISSRTTLESLYRDKNMSYAQVKDALCQIRGICEKLAGYFMEETGLVLLPEHIYYDLTNKKYIGLYYPDYRTEEPYVYKPLMDFLLEHIDTDDRNLAEIMYRICEMAEESSFFIGDALQILEEGQETNQERQQESSQETQTPQELLQKMPREAVREVLQEQIHMEDWRQSATGKDTYNAMEDYQDNVMEGFREQEEHKIVSPKRNSLYKVFAIISVLGITASVVIYNICELTQREEIILYGSAAAMGVCLLLCLAGIFIGRKGKVLSDENFNKEPDDGYSMGDSKLPPIDQVISRDMNLEMAGYTSVSIRPAYDAGKPLRIAESDAMQENNGFGNTVFFDESAVKEYKLYAMDKRNKKHIELKQFPCTIGKMAGCVDHVLSDDSISRIHARFDKLGEKVMLTDMNSTNGTFKNGLRMQPQETVEIEPGDEVRFGSLNYCYR